LEVEMKKYQYLIRNLVVKPISREIRGGFTDWIYIQGLNRIELTIIAVMFLIAFLLVIK
jgi:hypothetical protein